MNLRTLNVIRNLQIPDNQLHRCGMLFALDASCDNALYCSVDNIDDNLITVYVENGGWWFVFDRRTGKPVEAHPRVDLDHLKKIKLLWVGKCCLASRELYHNEAIRLIADEIKKGISFSTIGEKIKIDAGDDDEEDFDNIPF